MVDLFFSERGKKKKEENVSVQLLILFNETYFNILRNIFTLPLGR